MAVTTAATASAVVLTMPPHLLLPLPMLFLSTDGERQGTCHAHIVPGASRLVSATTWWFVVRRPLRHARTARAVLRVTCLPCVNNYDAWWGGLLGCSLHCPCGLYWLDSSNSY